MCVNIKKYYMILDAQCIEHHKLQIPPLKPIYLSYRNQDSDFLKVSHARLVMWQARLGVIPLGDPHWPRPGAFQKLGIPNRKRHGKMVISPTNNGIQDLDQEQWVSKWGVP